MKTGTATSALRHATPYLRLYRGKLFVIKAGGEAFVNPARTDALMDQIGVLMSLGIQCILVHGGGGQCDELAAKLGIETSKIQGRRKTSPEMIQAMLMSLNGQVASEILASARRLGLPAASVNGMSAGLIVADKRPTQPMDMGEVGDVASVDPHVLRTLLDSGILPVLSPLSGTADGQWLNINADTIAAAIAQAMGASKLVFMSATPGILHDATDPNSLISHLLLSELLALKADGTIAEGMIPKAEAIEQALRGGVDRVHVVSFETSDCLLTEVFTNEGSGTLIEIGESA